MANIFDQFDAPSAPNYANAISKIESGGNYNAIGPQTGKGRAVGKYQVMEFNVGPWTEEVLGTRMNPAQFLSSPEAQDKVFNAKFGSYVQKYGQDGAARAWFAGEGGMNNPNAKDVLGTTVAAYADKFNKSVAPQQAAAANPFDQFDARPKITVNPMSDRFVDAPAPANAAALQSGLERTARDMTTGPATSPGQRMAIEHANLLPAASQGATPNMGVLSKNLLSTDLEVRDDGAIFFRDPQTGAMVQTDNTKHIVMRDPADDRPKVYAKNDATTENPMVGAARVLAPGFVTGAPTQAMNVSQRAARVPTVQELKNAAVSGGYQSDAVKGLSMAPGELVNIVDRVKNELTNAGLSGPVAGTTWKLLDEAASAGGPVTGQNIQALRQSLSNAAKTPGTSDGAAAMKAKSIIDEMLPGVSATAGDPAATAGALKTADQNYSAAKDAEMLGNKMYRAELRAGAANSGMNTGNTIRQRLADVVTNEKTARGLTDEQTALAERIILGGKKENTYRAIGNMLGGGGGLPALVAGGVTGGTAFATTGDPKALLAGFAAPAMGMLFRAAGNRITMKQADKLDELLRSDSPLGKQLANPLREWEAAVRNFSQTQNARNFALANIASRNLSNNLKDAGVAVSPGELLRAIEGPVKSAAENDQPAVPRGPGQ